MDWSSPPKRGSTRQRQRRGEAFWREAIERQRASGVVQQEFCRQEGLALSTFARWSQRLSHRLAVEQLQAQPQFVQLIKPSLNRVDCPGEPARGLHVRLDLGGGLTIEIVRS